MNKELESMLGVMNLSLHGDEIRCELTYRNEIIAFIDRLTAENERLAKQAEIDAMERVSWHIAHSRIKGNEIHGGRFEDCPICNPPKIEGKVSTPMEYDKYFTPPLKPCPECGGWRNKRVQYFNFAVDNAFPGHVEKQEAFVVYEACPRCKGTGKV